MTGSGDTATLRMRGASHAEPKIHGGDRKGETHPAIFREDTGMPLGIMTFTRLSLDLLCTLL